MALPFRAQECHPDRQKIQAEENRSRTETHSGEVSLSANSRKALLALLLLVPAQSIATSMFFWWSETPTGKFIFVACKFWMALLPVVWLKFVDRGPLSWSPPKLGGFRVGAVL